MATTKITDLTAYTDPVNTDVLPIVDVTSDVTKKVSIANVMKNASLGTAAAPGIAFDGDPNTGIYSPGADQVAVTTGGTQRLLIDSAGAVTIAGDLTVNGTTTNINTQNLVVEDKNVVLGDVAVPTDVTADGGGITLKGTTDKTINWVDSTDAWTSSEHINIASSKEYRIAGTKVLDATSLGSSVLITSANITDGTIVNGDINASAAIAGTKISPDFGSQTITTTGVVSAALGAAATPSITFTGDTNTGIYSPGADQVAISTGGSGRLFVDSTGRVGIANSSPARALDITGTLRCSGRFESSSDAIISDWIYIGSASGARGVTSDAASRSLLFGINGSEVARFDTSGRLGVGTSSPGAALHVVTSGAGQIRYGDGTVTGAFGSHGLGDSVFVGSGAGLRFTTNGLGSSDTKMFIDTSGRVGIGTSSPSATLSVNSGATALNATFNSTSAVGSQLRFDSSGTAFGYLGTPTGVLGAGSTTGLAIRSEDILAFGTGGANERVRIDTSGRVGINTASPSATLDVLAAASTSVTGFKFASSTSVANNDIFRLQINGLTNGFRMFQDASSNVRYSFEGGNVGIGTTSPQGALVVSNSGANGFEVSPSAGSGTITELLSYNRSTSAYTTIRLNAAAHVFERAAGESARIDSSGRLLVGTSSTSSSAGLQVTSSTGGGEIHVSRYINSGSVVSTDLLGRITFGTKVDAGTPATSYDAASIACWADAAWGSSSDTPTRLVFSTTADGASSPTERMRIANNGQTRIGTTTSFSSATLEVNCASIGDGIGTTVNATTDRSALVFYNPNGLVGRISTNGSATAYLTSSDYRLKENVIPIDNGIARLQQLKPSRFNFVADPSKTVDGFVAHEVQDVVPEATSGTKDEVDAEGNPIYQGIDQSKLVPLLTAALQEAIGEIESLKARVVALESA